MLIKNLLLPAMTALVVMGTSTASADNNGIIFPPADNTRIYQYPPQIPPSPQLRNAPRMPAYTFGLPPNTQRPMMAPPQNMNRFSGNPATRYNGYPSQRPVAPYGMQNRQYPAYPRRNNNSNSGFPFSNNMMPFGNNGNNSFNPFSGGNMPFSGNSFSNPMNNMFGNNNNGNMPFFGNTRSSRKKAWGTERNIWPDFYTDFTDDAWDTITSGPRDLGTMPGGWRFPHISTPDPVTVSDAITNQFPPIMEEGGNMMDFSDWGVFE